jgi:hypothetical protein
MMQHDDQGNVKQSNVAGRQGKNNKTSKDLKNPDNNNDDGINDENQFNVLDDQMDNINSPIVEGNDQKEFKNNNSTQKAKSGNAQKKSAVLNQKKKGDINKTKESQEKQFTISEMDDDDKDMDKDMDKDNMDEMKGGEMKGKSSSSSNNVKQQKKVGKKSSDFQDNKDNDMMDEGKDDNEDMDDDEDEEGDFDEDNEEWTGDSNNSTGMYDAAKLKVNLTYYDALIKYDEWMGDEDSKKQHEKEKEKFQKLFDEYSKQPGITDKTKDFISHYVDETQSFLTALPQKTKEKAQQSFDNTKTKLSDNYHNALSKIDDMIKGDSASSSSGDKINKNVGGKKRSGGKKGKQQMLQQQNEASIDDESKEMDLDEDQDDSNNDVNNQSYIDMAKEKGQGLIDKTVEMTHQGIDVAKEKGQQLLDAAKDKLWMGGNESPADKTVDKMRKDKSGNDSNDQEVDKENENAANKGNKRPQWNGAVEANKLKAEAQHHRPETRSQQQPMTNL